MNNKQVAITAIIAALYIALGFMFQPISFLGIQFRVAELVVGICIIYPKSGLVGKIIGVFFVNLLSPLGALDLISCFINIPALMCIVALRNKKYLKYVGGILYAVIISFYVAWILNFVIGLPFGIMFYQVLIAEAILATAGIILFNYIGRYLPT